MQIAKVKYVGTTGATFTNNQVYDVLGWSGAGATIVASNGTFHNVTPNDPDWELEYLAVLELKQLYP